ncbi:MAG TPA: DUF2059 domain-containing protein [Fibrobacteraceae bacterium]|nr:DUF2059 domain-containing protein [Fibrobacteraceae bacterium]
MVSFRLSVFFLILCFALPVCSTAAPPPIGKAERAAIYRLLESQQVVQRIRQAVDAQIKETQQKHPNIPQSTIKMIQDSTTNDVILSQLAEAWAGKFSPKELDQIRIFLASDAGRKFLEINPAITAEMMAIGSLFGIHVYEMFHRMHPDAFPMEPRMEKFKKQMLDAREKARKGSSK